MPLLWNAEDEKEQIEIIFDYVQHSYIPAERKFRVYDPIFAYNLNCRAEIPKLFVELAKIEPEKRQPIADLFNGKHDQERRSKSNGSPPIRGR